MRLHKQILMFSPLAASRFRETDYGVQAMRADLVLRKQMGLFRANERFVFLARMAGFESVPNLGHLPLSLSGAPLGRFLRAEMKLICPADASKNPLVNPAEMATFGEGTLHPDELFCHRKDASDRYRRKAAVDDDVLPGDE